MTHHSTEQLSAEMQECIDLCSTCHDTCVEALRHCLERGGEHAEPGHVVALLDCAQACEVSRDFMLRGSSLHGPVCAVCAGACERCADSCEALGADDETMRRCAEICRRCAESCQAMTGSSSTRRIF